MTIEMCDCENNLLQLINDPKATRKTIAMAYAFALRSSEEINWPKINKKIIARWSVSGLEYIKNMAWSGKCFKEKP